MAFICVLLENSLHTIIARCNALGKCDDPLVVPEHQWQIDGDPSLVKVGRDAHILRHRDRHRAAYPRQVATPPDELVAARRVGRQCDHGAPVVDEGLGVHPAGWVRVPPGAPPSFCSRIISKD